MYICTQKQVDNTTYMYVYKHFTSNAILVNIANSKNYINNKEEGGNGR